MHRILVNVESWAQCEGRFWDVIPRGKGCSALLGWHRKGKGCGEIVGCYKNG